MALLGLSKSIITYLSVLLNSSLHLHKELWCRVTVYFRLTQKCVCDILKQPIVLDFKFLSVVSCRCETWSLPMWEEWQGVWEQGAGEGNCTQEVGSNRRFEKSAHWRASWFVCSNTTMVQSNEVGITCGTLGRDKKWYRLQVWLNTWV